MLNAYNFNYMVCWQKIGKPWNVCVCAMEIKINLILLLLITSNQQSKRSGTYVTHKTKAKIIWELCLVSFYLLEFKDQKWVRVCSMGKRMAIV